LTSAAPPPRLLFVSGLKREAALARGPDALAVCGGGAVLAERLAAAPPSIALAISFGLCGGLDPALQSGDVVVGTRALAGGESLPADEGVARALADRLRARGERVRFGAVVDAAAPVLARAAKAELRRTTEGIAVDMESAAAGRFAAARGARFAILRVVADPAGRDLPALAARAARPDGSVDYAAVLLGLCRAPWQAPALVAAARDSGAAFAALGRCRRPPGLFLGLADL
jgi:hopanoid-associated phosphorylase